MLSVVIPLFNKEKSIYSTLLSVCSQTFMDFEIIVVDDGSSDGGGETARAFPDSRVRYFRKSNGGVCSARNRGIQESRGEYIAFLDADDQWDKQYLQEQVRMIEDFPEAAMWGINFAELSNGTIIRKQETGLPEGFRGYVANYFQIPGRVSDLFCSSSVVIRKDVFNKVGLFDEGIKYSEDNDMWFRIISNYPVAFFDKYLVWYLQDSENRAMKKSWTLRYWLPYHVDKYKDPLYKQNTVFYRWIMRWAGGRIKLIYFNDPAQHNDAVIASRKLDYSMLPVKYRFELLTPYWFGKIVYRVLK